MEHRFLARCLPTLSLAALAACGGGRHDATSSAPAAPAPTAAPTPSAPAPSAQRRLAITGVRVFDGERTTPDATVLIEGDHIAQLGAGLTVPAGVETIDGRGKTLLPGLIDAHVHAYERAALEQALAFGVTTVLDMFSPPTVVAGLRKDPGLDHADVRSAGMLATAPGGHGTEYGLDVPTIDRPDQAPAWVAARIAEGSDYIKIVFDGGAAYGRKIPTVDVPTLHALIEAAHRAGKLAVVHIGDYASARLAIEHGADGLVHLFRDRAPEPGFGAFVAQHRAFITPTLAVTRGLYGGKSTLTSDPDVAPLLSRIARGALETAFRFKAVGEADAAPKAIGQLRAAGVAILAGTDAPNPGTAFGASLHDELALLVEAGLSPTEALTAATAAPAARFGLRDRGRIARGLRADLVLVEGDPTRDIRATRKIAAIWRGGQRFDRAAYRARLTSEETSARPAGPIGLVSDFDHGMTAQPGQPWSASVDGKSTANLAVVAGAHGSAGALEIRGELRTGAARGAWAGALWSPGAAAFRPVDLSAKSGLSFLARGDGKPYAVMVFTQRRGWMASSYTFQPGPTFAKVRVTWSQLDGSDGTDITGVLIGQATTPGPFALTIDDVTLE